MSGGIEMLRLACFSNPVQVQAFTFFIGKNTGWYGFNFVISEESASNRSGVDKEEIDQFLQAISPRRVIHRFVIGDHFLDTGRSISFCRFDIN